MEAFGYDAVYARAGEGVFDQGSRRFVGEAPVPVLRDDAIADLDGPCPVGRAVETGLPDHHSILLMDDETGESRGRGVGDARQHAGEVHAGPRQRQASPEHAPQLLTVFEGRSRQLRCQGN